MGCIAGEHFTAQPDGTLQCPAGFPLYPKARHLERDGSVRVVYAARIGHCRPCPRREECQGYGAATRETTSCERGTLATRHDRGSRCSPASTSSFPTYCVGRLAAMRMTRREVVKLLRHQRVDVELAETSPPAQSPPIRLISRAERAHYRLGWRAASSTQCSSENCSRGLDQAVWDTRCLCHLPRSSHRLSMARSHSREPTSLRDCFSLADFSGSPLWLLYGSVRFARLFSANRSKASSNRMTGDLLRPPHFVAHRVGIIGGSCGSPFWADENRVGGSHIRTGQPGERCMGSYSTAPRLRHAHRFLAL